MSEVRVSKPLKSWRLVHTDGKVLHLFESEGITHTIYNLQEFPSKAEAEAAIKAQGLEYTPEPEPEAAK